VDCNAAAEPKAEFEVVVTKADGRRFKVLADGTQVPLDPIAATDAAATTRTEA
jgi:hypothetical protein